MDTIAHAGNRPVRPEADSVRAVLSGQREKFQSMGIASMHLFGSAARGEAGADSDIDLIVEFKASTHPTLLTLGMLEHELRAIMDRPVDLAMWESLKPRVIPTVRQEAVCVFES